MSLSKVIAKKIRTTIAETLTEKRTQGKISKKQYQSILEVVENVSDAVLIEKTILNEKRKKFWIQKAVGKSGSLHKALKVPEGKKIPASKLKVKKGDSTSLKKKKVLAKTLSKMNKKGKKKD